MSKFNITFKRNSLDWVVDPLVDRIVAEAKSQKWATVDGIKQWAREEHQAKLKHTGGCWTSVHFKTQDDLVKFKKHFNVTRLKYETGNLLDLANSNDSPFDVIVHGCNCFNAMGGGIAREIAERYPQCAEIDAQTEQGFYNKLGNYTCYDTGKFVIVNAYTQYTPSIAGEDVFEYAAFELILKKLAHNYVNLHFGFPYIGMGLAGGDSTQIMALLEQFAEHMDRQGGSVTLVKFG